MSNVVAAGAPFAPQAPRLAAWMGSELGAARVDMVDARLLQGGAIQENWHITVDVSDGAWLGRHDWVLRRDRASQVGEGRTRSEEFAVLRAVHAAGVAVPRPVVACADPEVIGSEFLVMDWVPGVAAAHRLVKDDSLVPDRAALSRELGVQMARIHAVRPPHDGLSCLGTPPADAGRDGLSRLRLRLDVLKQAFPAIEWGLRTLLERAPSPMTATLVHRDYRTGNYLVHGGRPAAILDWEFADWGDPREDLGWFFAKCWRFGQHHRRAGGVGDAADFLRGYTETSQVDIEQESLDYWELFAHVRWAVIAAEQAQRHLSGQERSLELALTGRLVSQLEAEILRLCAGDRRAA